MNKLKCYLSITMWSQKIEDIEICDFAFYTDIDKKMVVYKCLTQHCRKYTKQKNGKWTPRKLKNFQRRMRSN